LERAQNIASNEYESVNTSRPIFCFISARVPGQDYRSRTSGSQLFGGFFDDRLILLVARADHCDFGLALGESCGGRGSVGETIVRDRLESSRLEEI
jgi:hypothetical protein